MNRMIIKMMAIKGIFGVTENDANMRFNCKWAPIMPRDREQLVNEISTRAAANAGSPEHLLELAGDVENIPEEVERMKKWIEFLAEVAQKAKPEQPKAPSAPKDPSKGTTPAKKGKSE